MNEPVKLGSTAFLYDHFPEAHEGKFDTGPNTWWFVADDVVGVANAEERGPGVWYFGASIVKPRHREHGIWSALHKQRTAFAIEQGAKILFTVSSRMNRSTYIRELWIPMTTYPYHEGFDEVVYFRCIR